MRDVLEPRLMKRVQGQHQRPCMWGASAVKPEPPINPQNPHTQVDRAKYLLACYAFACHLRCLCVEGTPRIHATKLRAPCLYRACWTARLAIMSTLRLSGRGATACAPTTASRTGLTRSLATRCARPASARGPSVVRAGRDGAPPSREIILPGAVWLLDDNDQDVALHGPDGGASFVMRALGADQPQQLMQQWGLVPAGKPGGLAVRSPASSTRLVAVPARRPQALAALPAPPACTGIVPFGYDWGSGGAGSSKVSEQTGIVPYEGGWLSEGEAPAALNVASGDAMMGMVLGAALSPSASAPPPLPNVSSGARVVHSGCCMPHGL